MEIVSNILLLLAAVLLNSHVVNSLVTPISIPPFLKSCYDEASFGLDATQVPSHQIQVECMRSYTYREADDNIPVQELSENIKNYLQSISRNINNEIIEMIKENRKPRHKRNTQGWRVRKEIRTLSRNEWKSFTDNLNRLKNDFTLEKNMSKYDILAALHSGTRMRRVHGGANFPGWHQVYLLAIETELRVPIPIWDSSLDFEMEDPVKTNLFTDRYFGEGTGNVVSGPFKNWKTISGQSLLRNIGSGESSLLTREAIDLVLNATSMDQIVAPQRGRNARHCLECHHNGPHIWTDGWLSGVNTAAWDPIFFCHHAMIDSIWSGWRDKMDKDGRKVVYPTNTVQGHRFNDTMGFEPFYPEIRNIDALHPYFRKLVRYEPYLRYPNCYGDDIVADDARRVCMGKEKTPKPVAIPKPSSRFGGSFFGSISKSFKRISSKKFMKVSKPKVKLPSKPLNVGPRFGASVFVDKRNKAKQLKAVDLDTKTIKAVDSLHKKFDGAKRSKSKSVGSRAKISKSIKSVNIFGKQIRRKKTSKVSEQSLKKVNDVVPLFARSRRSVQQKIRDRMRLKHHQVNEEAEHYYNSYMIDGKVDLKLWAFINVKVSYKRTLNSMRLATYPKCKSGGEGTEKVYIESEGLNYIGKYKTFVVVDAHKTHSEFVKHIGFKRPLHLHSEFLLTVHDHCGRACKPTCLNMAKNPPQYRPCSGAFKVNNNFPLMYSHSNEGDKTKRINELDSKDVMNVPVEFICDYENKWPWSP